MLDLVKLFFGIFILVGSCSLVASPSCVGQEMVSPEPLRKIRDRFSPPSVTVDGKLSKEPTHELRLLKRLQTKWLNHFGKIRSKAWCNFINAGDDFGTVMLVDTARDFRQEKFKQIHRYPKLEDVTPVRTFETVDDLDVVLVLLGTPEMFARGMGFRRKGIELLNVDSPENASHLPKFEVASMICPRAKSVDSFHSMLESAAKNPAVNFEVRSNSREIEVRLWPKSGNRGNCQRWIFSIEKGGLCTFFEDQIPQQDATVAVIEYRKFSKEWFVPRRARATVFSRKTGDISRITDTSLFDIERIETWQNDEFSLNGLPIEARAQITDRRPRKAQKALGDN